MPRPSGSSAGRSSPPSRRFRQASAGRVEEAGEQLVAHLSTLGRKPSTLNTYRSLLRAHLSPGLGDLTLDRVEPVHVERLVASMRHGGAGAKLTSNALTLLFQVFEFGRRKGWCERNPVKQVDRPEVEEHHDIRFLTIEEVEALLARGLG